MGEFAKLFNISTMTLGFGASQRRKLPSFIGLCAFYPVLTPVHFVVGEHEHEDRLMIEEEDEDDAFIVLTSSFLLFPFSGLRNDRRRAARSALFAWGAFCRR